METILEIPMQVWGAWGFSTAILIWQNIDLKNINKEERKQHKEEREQERKQHIEKEAAWNKERAQSYKERIDANKETVAALNGVNQILKTLEVYIKSKF